MSKTKSNAVLTYIKTVSPDLAQVIVKNGISRILQPKKDSPGLTFLMPSQELVKKLKDLSEGDSPEEAIELIQGLIIMDYIPTLQQFLKMDDIMNFLQRRVSLHEKAPTIFYKNSYIQLINGAEIRSNNDFKASRGKDDMNINVFNISKEFAPTDGDDVKARPNKQEKKVTVYNYDRRDRACRLFKLLTTYVAGRSPLPHLVYMCQFIRWLETKILPNYEDSTSASTSASGSQSGGQSGGQSSDGQGQSIEEKKDSKDIKDSKNSTTTLTTNSSSILSIAYQIENQYAAIYTAVLEMLDWNPLISFYIVFQPYRTKTTKYIPDELYNEWEEEYNNFQDDIGNYGKFYDNCMKQSSERNKLTYKAIRDFQRRMIELKGFPNIIDNMISSIHKIVSSDNKVKSVDRIYNPYRASVYKQDPDLMSAECEFRYDMTLQFDEYLQNGKSYLQYLFSFLHESYTLDDPYLLFDKNITANKSSYKNSLLMGKSNYLLYLAISPSDIADNSLDITPSSVGMNKEIVNNQRLVNFTQYSNKVFMLLAKNNTRL